MTTGESPLHLVLTSEANREKAEALSLALLDRRLVACASLLPVRSHYRWQGRLEASEEVQFLLKTSPEHLEALHLAVLELHSYEVPEWIHWPAHCGGDYGSWCQDQLSPGAGAQAPATRPGGGDPTG